MSQLVISQTYESIVPRSILPVPLIMLCPGAGTGGSDNFKVLPTGSGDPASSQATICQDKPRLFSSGSYLAN